MENINTNKKIGLLLPVYNGEIFINKCFDSLINQSLIAFDLYIINDGSNDSTDKLIIKFISENYKKIKINYLNSKKRRGYFRSFKILLKYCKNEYFLVIGHDDFLDLNYFEKIINSDAYKNKSSLIATKTIGYHVYNEKMVSLFEIEQKSYTSDFFNKNFFDLDLGSLYLSVLSNTYFGINSYRKMYSKIKLNNPFYDEIKKGFLNDHMILVFAFNHYENISFSFLSNTIYYKGVKELDNNNGNINDGRLISSFNYPLSIYYSFTPLLKSINNRIYWFLILYIRILRPGLSNFYNNRSLTSIKIIFKLIFVRKI